ncbi:MAG: hypothetical protein H0V12_07145 [Chloroflexi bacterium]|nr:hypothetical protein [Chloroflexota bacterium]
MGSPDASTGQPTAATIDPSAPVPSADPGGGFPTEIDARLLTRIPSTLRASCGPTEATADEQAGALSVVDCQPRGNRLDPTFVRYFLFNDPRLMDGAYEAQLAQARAQDDVANRAGLCFDPPFTGAFGRYDRPNAGSVVCYRDDQGRAVFLWTVDALRIVALAYREDGNHKDLFDWWVDSSRSGPLG